MEDTKTKIHNLYSSKGHNTQLECSTKPHRGRTVFYVKKSAMQEVAGDADDKGAKASSYSDTQTLFLR